MPNVGSNDFKAARGVNDFVAGIPYGKDGTTGGPSNDGWKYGYAVYAHNGSTWVEVWNARPIVTSSTFTVSNATTLSFTGTADPNNFATTATFEYREVGGTYADANTTTAGLGNNVDGAVSFSVTKTGIDGFKNWEAQAKGTNIAGVGYGAVLYRDCRKTSTWSPSTVDNPTVGTCNNRTYTKTTTYTRDGCPTYSETGPAIAAPADCVSACYDANEVDTCGGCGSKTITKPKPGSNCPSTTTGSCGAWSGVDPYGSDDTPIYVPNGTYAYVRGSIWGWLYCNQFGTLVSGYENCGYYDYALTAGGVEQCSLGGFRVTGTDQCVQLSV